MCWVEGGWKGRKFNWMVFQAKLKTGTSSSDARRCLVTSTGTVSVGIIPTTDNRQLPCIQHIHFTDFNTHCIFWKILFHCGAHGNRCNGPKVQITKTNGKTQRPTQNTTAKKKTHLQDLLLTLTSIFFFSLIIHPCLTALLFSLSGAKGVWHISSRFQGRTVNPSNRLQSFSIAGPTLSINVIAFSYFSLFCDCVILCIIVLFNSLLPFRICPWVFLFAVCFWDPKSIFVTSLQKPAGEVWHASWMSPADESFFLKKPKNNN